MSLSKLLRCGVALAVLALFGAGLSADDKKAAPSGSWKKKEGQEVVIEFADKGVVKFHPHGEKGDVTVVCSFTAEKDGVLKIKITDHEGKEELKAKLKDRLPVGTDFKFKWVVSDDSATLEEMDGKEADLLKSHLEGGYEKKK